MSQSTADSGDHNDAPDLDLDLGTRLGPFYEMHGPEIIPVGYEEVMEPLAATMGTYVVRSNLAELDGQRIILGHYDLTMFIQEDWDRMMVGQPVRRFLVSSRGPAYAAGRLAEEVVLEKLLQRQTLLGAVVAEVLDFREAKERGLVQSVKRGVRSDDVVIVFDDGRIGALESKASFRPSSAYLRTSLGKINAQLRAQLQADPGVTAVFAARISLTAHTIELAGATRDRFLASGLPWPSESEAMDHD